MKYQNSKPCKPRTTSSFQKRMWFLLEQCERVQTSNQSNTVNIGKILFLLTDSLVYKYFSIKIWFGILDEYCLQIFNWAYLNETSPVQDYRLINQISSLIVRSMQIKLSGVIKTHSGVHKGFGFCVMLLTDINETTNSSERLWAPFHSADFKRVEAGGEEWDGPNWDSWMTDKGVVFCWSTGIWRVKEKKPGFEELFRYHAKTNIP